MNPYAFVPLGPAAPRKKINTHDKFTGFSGALTCQLKTLTHFFIAGIQERAERQQHQELILLREGGKPVIPGSSLKGAIRHLAEAISGSCLALPNTPRMRAKRGDRLEYYDYQKRSRDSYPLPDGFSPCGLEEPADPEKQAACPACRIFGYLSRDVISLGNVSFETARIIGDYRTERIILEPFGSPGPRHKPFYATKESNFREPRGRKFYYHRIDGARTMAKKLDFNKTVEAILPGAVFEFSVQYQNLSETDLALLIFALSLEEPMRHKLGMGKGVGLGSVHLTVTAWETLDRQNRYRHFGGGAERLSGEALQEAISRQIAAYHRHFASWKDSLAALKDILTWDEKHPRNPRYPSNAWFKANPGVALEDVPADAAEYGRQSAGGSAPSHHTPKTYPATERHVSGDKKEADKLLKQLQKQQQAEVPPAQTAYRDGDTEPKAIAHLAADGSWQVVLPRLPGQPVRLKTKPRTNAAEGGRLRVRVVVGKDGRITRADEI
ncbi:MAG: hypothetical protein HUU32_16945 [Calditrichaceae bacterium]|nr:RAMP superfamily CRISPR-associated protein [Calditrichia bacterium]NUQ43079.1 hypothetical protein [Calditrichaceae bacterium]